MTQSASHEAWAVSKLKRPDSPLRAARSNNFFSLRAVFAALLTLAILSSAVPFIVLSAAHSCSMPCCAGSDGGCTTGACKDALFKRPKKSEEEKLCGVEDAHQAHGAKRDSAFLHTVKASTNSDHCGSEENDTSQARRPVASSGADETNKTDLVSALSLSSPCSNNCCAGASASTQSRRSRDSALLFAVDRALPPVFISLSQYSKNLPPVSSAHLKRLRARAPPTLLTSNTA